MELRPATVRNVVGLQNAMLMKLPFGKSALGVVLASYVLATVGAPLLHRHRIRATCDPQSHCDGGCLPATDAEGLLARGPAGACASGTAHPPADDACPVCHFLAQKWLSAEAATVTACTGFARIEGLGEVPRKVRPVPFSWRIRAPPATA